MHLVPGLGPEVPHFVDVSVQLCITREGLLLGEVAAVIKSAFDDRQLLEAVDDLQLGVVGNLKSCVDRCKHR